MIAQAFLDAAGSPEIASVLLSGEAPEFADEIPPEAIRLAAQAQPLRQGQLKLEGEDIYPLSLYVFPDGSVLAVEEGYMDQHAREAHAGATAAEALSAWRSPPHRPDPAVLFPPPPDPAIAEAQGRRLCAVSSLGAEEFCVRWSHTPDALKGEVTDGGTAQPPRKIVFLAGYRPPASFRGTLPKDGEEWVCSLVRDTQPGARKGVLLVKLRRPVEYGWVATGRPPVYGVHEVQWTNLATGGRGRLPFSDEWAASSGFRAAESRRAEFESAWQTTESVWWHARRFGAPLRIELTETLGEPAIRFVYAADAHGCPRQDGQATADRVIPCRHLASVGFPWEEVRPGAFTRVRDGFRVRLRLLAGGEFEADVTSNTGSWAGDFWAGLCPTTRAAIQADLTPSQTPEELAADLFATYFPEKPLSEWLSTYAPGAYEVTYEQESRYAKGDEDDPWDDGSQWTVRTANLMRVPPGESRYGHYARRVASVSATISHDGTPVAPPPVLPSTMEEFRARLRQDILRQIAPPERKPALGLDPAEWRGRYLDESARLIRQFEALLDEWGDLADEARQGEIARREEAAEQERAAEEDADAAGRAAEASGVSRWVLRETHGLERPCMGAVEMREYAAAVRALLQHLAEERHQVALRETADAAARQAEIDSILSAPGEAAPWYVDSDDAAAALVARGAKEGRGIAGLITGTSVPHTKLAGHGGLLAPGTLSPVSVAHPSRGGGKRYSVELLSTKWVRALEQATDPDGTPQRGWCGGRIEGLATQSDWHVAWVRRKDGEPIEYIVAAAGGISSLRVGDGGHYECLSWAAVRANRCLFAEPSPEDRGSVPESIVRQIVGLASASEPEPRAVPVSDVKPASAAQFEALRNKFGRKR